MGERFQSRIGIGILFILIVVVTYSITDLGLRFRANHVATASFEKLAACLEPDVDPTYASSCLRSTIENLLSYLPTKDVQAYTVATTSPESVRNNCHQIGHIIGAETYKQFKQLDLALSQCSSACTFACTHGAVGAGVMDELGETYPDEDIAHAGDKTIAKIGSQYCEESVPLCHGIGHLPSIPQR